MFNTTSALLLHYTGRGVGGCNLPFGTVESALSYAASRYATEARVEERSTGKLVVKATRPDARHKFTLTQE